jgi:hypothetical protein
MNGAKTTADNKEIYIQRAAERLTVEILGELDMAEGMSTRIFSKIFEALDQLSESKTSSFCQRVENYMTVGHDWEYCPRDQPLYNPWGPEATPVYKQGMVAGEMRWIAFRNEGAFERWMLNR